MTGISPWSRIADFADPDIAAFFCDPLTDLAANNMTPVDLGEGRVAFSASAIRHLQDTRRPHEDGYIEDDGFTIWVNGSPHGLKDPT